MRISDWSSDVCSSDLRSLWRNRHPVAQGAAADLQPRRRGGGALFALQPVRQHHQSQGGREVAAVRRSAGPRVVGHRVPGAELHRIQLDAEPGLSSARSEEHTSELQTLMRISYAVFCLKNKHYLPRNNT